MLTRNEFDELKKQAQVLKNERGLSATEMAKALIGLKVTPVPKISPHLAVNAKIGDNGNANMASNESVNGISPAEMAQILQLTGYSATEVAAALKDTYAGITSTELSLALAGAFTSPALTADQLALILKNTGYSSSDALTGLKAAFPNLSADQLNQAVISAYGEPGGGWTNLRKLSPVGGRGNSFDDNPDPSHIKSITKLIVRCGNIIDQIRVFYGDVAMPPHGGNGGGQQEINLQPGEYITEVSGYDGWWFGAMHILQLTFKTNKGSTFGPYGNMQYASSSTPFSLKGNSGEGVVGFFGSTASHTDGLVGLGSIGLYVATWK